MIHAYAFTAGLVSLPALDGLDGEPLEVRTIDGLEAVVSCRRAESSRRGLRAEALVHGTVVEALVDRAAAVLPVRFGETAPDDDSFARAVRARAEGLRRSLDRVRGCVEVGVRIASLEQPVALTGTDYLRARRAATGGELHDQLRLLARDSRSSAGGSAYLVPRESLPAVQERARRFALAHPELTVVCTGPWAPYNFTTAAAP